MTSVSLGTVRSPCRVQRKTDGRVHIIHLSDLHFRQNAVFGEADGAEPDAIFPALEAGLKRCVEERGPPDLLVVTGDIIDGDLDFLFRKGRFLSRLQTLLAGAKGYLLDLSRKVLNLEPDDGQLLIVPGNHDFRFSGLWSQPLSKQEFLTTFGEFCRHTWFPELNLLVACFDSNVSIQNLELATGFVRPQQIDDLEARLVQKKQTDKEYASFGNPFRIALVHHHPLPLAEAESTVYRRRIERFVGRQLDGAPELLLLRNAGSFLDRLMRNGYRLLLHGHLHHYASMRFSKTTVNPPLDGRLQVLACGSTCTPGIVKEYSFNSVRIFDEGFVDCMGFSCPEATLYLHHWQTRALGTAPYEE